MVFVYICYNKKTKKMTRVNAGIPVRLLSDQHLIAEHREIKRIPNTRFVSKPTEHFKLGTGHVLFFSNKPKYTYERFCEIHKECLIRGFDVTDYGQNWRNCAKNDAFSDYTPSQEDVEIVVDRIISNVQKSTQVPRYYGKPITKDEYVSRLLELKNK